VQTSYDYVLARYGFGWVAPHSLRMLVLNGIALVGALIGYSRQPALFRLIASVLCNLPRAISWHERLKIARIASRNLGIHLIVNQAPADRLILADEGLVQAVHYLFVYLNEEPDYRTLERYLALIPLPDLVLYYRQPKALLVERTMRRGHKRIPDPTPNAVEQFIGHAYHVLEHVAATALLSERRFILDGQSDTIVARPTHVAETDAAIADATAGFLHLLAQYEQTVLGNKRTASGSVATNSLPENSLTTSTHLINERV